MMVCVRKENICTHRVNDERRKMKEFGMLEMLGKEQNMCEE